MSTTALCISAMLLIIPIAISIKEKLHIAKELIVASIRAVIQLVILGFILHFIFDLNSPWILILFVLV
ncbi:ABC transporter permease, partial [Staphylococcus carnosus]